MRRAKPPGPVRILLAEEEPDLRDLVAYRLSRSGYAAIEAADGEQALRLAVATGPDLAVLDVVMPKMDGCQVARALRAAPATRRIPIILLTARNRRADINQALQAGADDYLGKPFSPDELVARVRLVLGRLSREAAHG